MSTNSDFDKIARTWLQDGPSQIADRSLQAALDEVHVTSQQRFGVARRSFPMNSNAWRIAAAAVIAVLIIGAGVAFLGRTSSGGVGGGPAATPTPSPTAAATESAAPTPRPTVPPLTQTFTSNLHGYSIKYPASWTATPATAAWPPGPGLNWGNAGLDELRGASARLTGTSQPLVVGQTAAAWMRAYGGDPSAWQPIAIGDQTGYIDYDGALAQGGIVPGGLLYDAVVVVDARGYNFTLDGNVDHDYFVAMLATVVFDPAAAVDPNPAP
jgi:hypothetical protein